MSELTEKFLESLGRELGFAPETTENGLVPLQFGKHRALLHFRGRETLVVYAEIGRPLAVRRPEALEHFMSRNLLLAEPGSAVFSYTPHDNMLGVNMRLEIHTLDIPLFLQALRAFLDFAAESAKQLALMNDRAPAPSAPEEETPTDDSGEIAFLKA